LSLAKAGAFDGSVVWWKTPEREKDFFFSDPVLDVRYVFFHLKSNPFDWKTVEDLKDVEIGATTGYDYGESFQNAEKNREIFVQRVPMDELNFKKLLKKKIEVFPVDVEVGYTMLKKIFPPEEVALFTHHPTPIRSDPHHLILSKKNEKNEKLVALFNRGLKRLRENGLIFKYLAESRRGEYRKKSDRR
ncbi:MAG: ABC transporter substrate-binding protein, partial [Desulfobacterales bacterium]|nr:ABC transporter substrate-binding protein [Desulfobacterales bacterium]